LFSLSSARLLYIIYKHFASLFLKFSINFYRQYFYMQDFCINIR